jgi:hypothetical protein
MAVTWIKWKYACPKTRGRYSGGTHNGPPKKRKKNGPKVGSGNRMMILQASGKVAWDWKTA